MYNVAGDAYLRMMPWGWLWTEWETLSVTVIIIIAVVVKDILALSHLYHSQEWCVCQFHSAWTFPAQPPYRTPGFITRQH